MLDIRTLHEQLIEKALPSGFEQEVGDYLGQLAAPYVDEVTRDALGNVLCHKKGSGPRIMLAAHMDLIGFMITFIDEKGFLRFEPIGGHKPAFLHRTPVRLRGRDGSIVSGVILCAKWAEAGRKNTGDIRPSDLYIDIGAGSYEKASALVSIGDVAVFDGETVQQGDKVLTPYADDLIACVVLLRTMELLQESPYDVWFVFTVQEEVGCRGAATAAFAIHPDMGIAVDVCGTGDTPSAPIYSAVRLGAGPTVKIKDGSAVCNPQVVQFLRDAAQREGLAYQDEILLSGGTDAASIQRSHGGILAGGVSIPTRNVHSPREIYSLRDVEGAASLLAAALRQRTF